MVQEYLRPASLEEALSLKASHPGAAYLAGGTFLLAGDYRDKPEALIDLSRLLPRRIELGGGMLRIGAGASFQDLVEAEGLPKALKDAALSMVNRNVRNRASVGGNLGAAKSCASLIPVLLALGATARVSTRSAKAESMSLEAWLEAPQGLVLELELPLMAGARAAFARLARTACDVSVLTCSVAYRLAPTGALEGVRLALGGLGPRARLFPELSRLLEGRPLPSREAIEAAARPLFHARTDWRGSSAYKELRAAALVAEALYGAEELA